MYSGISLHVVHVAGTRMIRQGTDGLSRGNFSTGVMNGVPMSNFVPLHLTAQDHSSRVLAWVQSWATEPNLTPLSPTDWFERGHGILGGARNPDGVWIPHQCTDRWFLWLPAPGAAATVMHELSISRHKRTFLGHIFLCPRLLTNTWRQKLHRVAALVIDIPAGCRPFWPSEMHEPLILGLTLPFSDLPPWQLR